jgi:hypothetical protein
VSFHIYNGVGATGGAEATFSGGNNLTLASWYHVVGVFDGANATVYVNGVAGSPMVSMSGSQARDTWDPLTIGCGRGLNNNRFGGSLDEVAIYTNALSSTQVTTHYNIGVGGGNYLGTVLADNPYMYWRMDAPVYTAPTVSAYPAAANFGKANAGGLYLTGTTPGAAGPSLSGLGSPSYACALNGMGTASTNGIPLYTNSVAFGANLAPAGSGIIITNLDDALNLRSNNISVMAWFKSNPADNRFQGLVGHSDSNWRLAMGNGGNAGKLQWNFGAGGDLVSTRNYNDGQWHFAVAVYTNTGVPAAPGGWLATNYLYVDGILDNSALVTNLASATSTTNVMIGCAPDYTLSGNNNVYRPQRFFAGSLAHVAYLTNALTGSQVASLYSTAGGVPLPVITGQPVTGRTNGAGGNNGSGTGSFIFFGVNTLGATSYQWYFNSSSNYTGATLLVNGAKYTNTTTLNMTVSNLVDSDSGYYYVVVGNSYGSVTSILATLKVSTEPLITSQSPAGSSLQLYQNQNYTLSVTAIGQTPFTYQWFTNGVADSSAAGKNQTYGLTSVQPAMTGYTYQCVVSNSVGSATNGLLTLTVLTLPGNLTGSAYGSTLLGMNPSGYWPMHEVAAGVRGDVETNLGSLGNLANAYYADWTGSIAGTGIVHQVTGALAGDSDPATGFNNTPNNGSTTYPAFAVIPRTAAATTLKPPFTLEAWAKPFTSGFGDIISENGSLNGVNNQNDGVRLSWGSGGGGTATQGFQVFVGNGSARTALPGTPTTFAIGQWYHVACTFDGATWILYVNGNPVVTQPTNATFTLAVDSGSPIAIAQGLWSSTGPGRAFPGAIDEVAIYTNVLDPSEIGRHYAAGTDPNANPTYKQLVLATNPIVYLRMDAPAYAAPSVGTWPALTNYGAAGVNGVYSPGSMPGAVAGPPALGLSGNRATPGNGMSSFADAGFDPSFNPTTNAFSYSAWFKGNPGDTRSFQSIVGHTDNSWRAAINGSGKLQAHGGGGDVQSSAVVNDGNWHHFVMTYSGTNTGNFGTNTLYLDGVLVATNTGVGNVGTNLNVYFGDDPQYTNNPYGIGRNLAGSVCEVAFWNNTVLSPNQAVALWNAAGVPPYIVTQPISASVNQNSVFTNTIVANGSATLAYQWYQDGAPLAGQTSGSLVLNPVQASNNSSDYYAVVTNSYGAVTSAVVSLTVFTSPTINSQFPIPYTNLFSVFAASSPTFTIASASGATPLSYQWYTNGVKDMGGTNATYKLNNVQLGFFTNYCVVSNFVGMATSFVWSAAVIPVPSAPYPQSVLNLKPIGYWRLDEPDDGLSDGNLGVIAHDYVGGNDGIYTNTQLGGVGYTVPSYAPVTDPSATPAAFGALSAVDSDAFNVAGIDFSGPTNTSHNFSIEAWVNGFPQTSDAGIVTKGYGGGGEQFSLDTGSGSHAFRFFVRDAGGATHIVTSTIQPGSTWHHLVGVCDQSDGVVTLYIDGQAIGTAAITPGSGILASTNLTTIGARKSSAIGTVNNLQFIGYIGEVAVYNFALSQAQVQASFFSGGIPPFITLQPPANVQVSEGGTLSFAAGVSGTPPLTNQWWDATANAPVTDQTNTTLLISNAPVSLDNHQLYFQAINEYGSTNSSMVTVSVAAGPPQITASNLPPVVTLPTGKSFTYSVQASGSLPLSYQWYAGASPISGQTNSSYAAVAGTPGSSIVYSVVITNIHGSLTSASSTLTAVAYPSDAYSAATLALNPIGYWRLQETNAPAAATIETNYGVLGAAGNAYYAINTASQPRISFGQTGALTGDSDTAVSFSGPSGTNFAFVPRITPALTMKPPLTYEAWINSSSTTFSDIVGEGSLNGLNGSPNLGGVRLCYGGNNAGGPNLQLFNANGNGNTRNGVGAGANSLPVGLWHHCVATYDGTTVNLYVDGALLTTSTALSGANTEAIDTWSPFTIGDGLWQGSGTGPTRSFTGLVDEVAVYTNILDGTQVTNHYVAGTFTGSYRQTVLADNPLLYYRMDAPGYVAPEPALFPEAINFGTAPPNGAYPAAIVPGAVAGPNILGLGTNVAVAINGILSCVDAGNDAAFNPTNHQPFSVVTWFKGNPADPRVQTVMSHGTTNWAMNLDGTTGRIVWNLFNGGQVTSTNILNDGNWHFVGGVYDGATSYLYVDGVLNSSGAAASAIASEPNAELFLGGNPDFTVVGVNQRYLAGALAQAAMFTNALSAAQIQHLYAVATVPTITLTRSGSQVVITYTGTLLSSTNVTGTYTPVAGASSPYSSPPSGDQKFYRTRNP